MTQDCQIKFSGLLFAGAQLGFSPVIKTVVSEVIFLIQIASSDMLKPEKQNVTDMLIFVKYKEPKRCSTWVHFNVHCYCQGVPDRLTEHGIFTCLSFWLCQHCSPLKAVLTISELASISLFVWASPNTCLVFPTSSQVT